MSKWLLIDPQGGVNSVHDTDPHEDRTDDTLGWTTVEFDGNFPRFPGGGPVNPENYKWDGNKVVPKERAIKQKQKRDKANSLKDAPDNKPVTIGDLKDLGLI